MQEKAGISADQARQAIEAVVGFLKDKLPDPLGDQLAKFVDGDDDEGGDDSGGGMLGGITDKLGGLLGGGD